MGVAVLSKKVPKLKPPVALPSGFTPLVYIQSNGTQYIDTGMRANQNTRIVMDCQAHEIHKDGSFPFGVRTSVSSAAFCPAIMLANQVFYNFGAAYQFADFSALYDRLVIDANKNVCSFIGKTTATLTLASATFTSASNIVIGTAANAGVPYVGDNAWKGKIYSAQMYDNGTLVRDFVPCISNADTVGLYDLVEGKFYGSMGSGNFIGSEVA